MSTKKSETAYAKYQQSFEDKQAMPILASWYTNIEPGVSSRPPYSRETYETFRPNETIPKNNSQENQHRIMMACNMAYEKVGIIRSVIDLMVDFICDDIRIEHPDAEPNAFWQAWAKKINLRDRAEQFTGWTLRTGNVVVRRQTVKLQHTTIQRFKDKSDTAHIPLRYVMYDPSTVDLLGGQLAALSSNKQYALKIPSQFIATLEKSLIPEEKAFYEGLPSELKSAGVQKGMSGFGYVKLPPDETYVAHYKKNDTDMWATSFIYAILSDVQYNEKVKQAKISALDGMINVIRLWQLGDHKEDRIPTPPQFARLASILQGNTGGGAMDIIWGSDIKLDEFYPPIDKLTGLEPDPKQCLIGIGIPGSLLGIEDSKGSQNPFLGLRNFVKKISATRQILCDWLNTEIDLINAEMGFRKRPHICFNNADLTDDTAYYTLLKDLVDRNIISDQTVLERVKEVPEMERVRLKEEADLRKEGELTPKASPFFNPQVKDQQKHELKKIDLQNAANLAKQKAVGAKPAGRPGGAKDSSKRKRGATKIRGRSSKAMVIQASKLYDQTEKIITALVMAEYGLKDSRQLTTEQKNMLENSIIATFPYIDPDVTEVTQDMISEAFETKDGPFDEFYMAYHIETDGIKLTHEEKRMIKILAYSEAWLGYV